MSGSVKHAPCSCVPATSAKAGAAFCQTCGGEAVKVVTPKREGERSVLVTTAIRGVFFGYAVNTDGETIALRACRNVLYWSADVKGFVGLAANGPTSGCRVGPAADITLRNITAVVEVTDAATLAFERAPWTK